jgi:hypothetical protein
VVVVDDVDDRCPRGLQSARIAEPRPGEVLDRPRETVVSTGGRVEEMNVERDHVTRCGLERRERHTPPREALAGGILSEVALDRSTELGLVGPRDDA